MATRVIARSGDASFVVEVGDDGGVSIDGAPPCRIAAIAPGELTIERDGPRARAFVAGSGATRWVFVDGAVWEFEVGTAPGRRSGAAQAGGLSAPMPATVIRIAAAPGSAVRRGDTVLVLEAMKMELPLRAPRDGTVRSVRCKEGELVQPGVMLVELE
jgi:biotin carboxyl carrier protein